MRKLLALAISLVIFSMLLAGCGGGSSTSGTNNTVIPPTAAKTVTGVAATGTPISGTVYLKDSSSPATEISTPINSDGSYSFDVSGLTAPFILKAVGSANGQNYTLYSLAGEPGIANINPLSHLAVVRANNGADPASLYANLTPTQVQAIKTALATIIPQIQALLQQVLSQYGVTTTNFISDAYAANHMGLDLLFDMITIVASNGSLTITNRMSGAAILTTTLSGNTLSGQLVTANIPTIATQAVGAVYVYPASTSVATGGSASFKSIVLGTTNQTITWNVVEASGGSITIAGVYMAPSTAGTYHVKATSVADTSKTATATITVTGGGSTAPVAGLMGGSIQDKVPNLTGPPSVFAGDLVLSGTSNGIGPSARFGWLDDVTTDGTNLYVVDATYNNIRKVVIATGVVTTIAGTTGAYGSVDGTGSAARLFSPRSITTDGTNLYVGDNGNYTIRKIVLATGTVTTIAGTASVSGSVDGTGAAARFNNLRGITTDGTNLYVADYGNNTIRKMVLATGVVTTIAGTAGTTGSVDGTGAVARFNSPIGITTDNTNLYVSDIANNTIRKIVISTGVVTTLAGSATTIANAASLGPLDGIGAAARLVTPYGVTTDGINLYVTSNNATGRKIVISTGAVTSIQTYTGFSVITDGTNLYMATGTFVGKI